MAGRWVVMKAKILLVCLALVIALFLSEITLRLLLPTNYYVWPPHLRAIFKPDPQLMPGVSGESRFEISSLGFRADELTPAHDIEYWRSEEARRNAYI